MCGSSTTTSTTSIPPEFLQAYRGVAGAAQNFYDTTKPQNYSDNPNDFVAQTNAQQRAGMGGVDNYANYAQPYYQSATGTLFNAANQGYMGTQQAQNTAAGAGAAAAPYTGAFGQNLNTGLSAGADYANKSQAFLNAANQGASPYNQSADYFGRQAYQNASPYNAIAGQGISSALQGAQPYNSIATGLAGAGTQAVNADQIGGRQINQFMSPYIGSVLQGTAGMLNQQNQQAMSGQTGNAIMSGAFGGDRAGIAAANLQQQQQLANSKIYSDILNQGYGQALGAAQQQQGVNLGAAQANRAALQQGSGQMLNIGQQGYGQGLGAAQAQGALGQQIYGQGMGLSQQQQGLGQQIFGQGATTAEQQAALGNQLFNQNSTAASQNAAMAQQQFAQQMAMSQQQAALAQQMYDQGASTSAATAGLGAGAQSAGLQGSQAQMAAGQIQQQTDQAAKQAMYNQWYQTQYGLPQELLGTYANAIEGIGQNAGSSTVSRGPSSLLSDERLKENIHPIGKTNDGQNIYRYNFKGDHRTQIGLLAQEVERHHPGAVGLAGGWKTVDYAKATDGAMRHHRYAGGPVSAHEGGHVGMEHMGEGYADGGSPGGYDPNSMIDLLHQQQGMYGSGGLGGPTPPGAPGARSTPYTPPAVAHATPPTPQSHDGGGQQQPDPIQSLAKGFVDRKVGDQLDKTWDKYAAKPVENFMNGASNKFGNLIHPTTPPPPVSGGAGAGTLTGGSGAGTLTGGMGSVMPGLSGATAAGSAALPAAMLPAVATTAAEAAPVAAAAVPAAVEGLTSMAQILGPLVFAANRGGSVRAHRAAGGLAAGRHGYAVDGTVDDPNHVSFENSLVGKLGSGINNLTRNTVKDVVVPGLGRAAANFLAPQLAAGQMLQPALAQTFGGDKVIGNDDSSLAAPAAKTAPPTIEDMRKFASAPPPAAAHTQGLGGGRPSHRHAPSARGVTSAAPTGEMTPDERARLGSFAGLAPETAQGSEPTSPVTAAPTDGMTPDERARLGSFAGLVPEATQGLGPIGPSGLAGASTNTAPTQASHPQFDGIGKTLKGLGHGLHDALLPEGGYWDQLKGGKASAWIPLIQGISAAATSPYSNLGTALLYGAGTAASKYLPTQQAQADVRKQQLANTGTQTAQQIQGYTTDPVSGKLIRTDTSGLTGATPITVGASPNSFYLNEYGRNSAKNALIDYGAAKNQNPGLIDESNKVRAEINNAAQAAAQSRPALDTQASAVADLIERPEASGRAAGALTDWVTKFKGAADTFNRIAGKDLITIPTPEQLSSDPEIINKVSREIAMARTQGANQNSLGALEGVLNSVPHNALQPLSNAILMASSWVNNQFSLDQANGLDAYDAASGVPGHQSLAQYAQRAVMDRFNSAEMDKDKNILTKIFYDKDQNGNVSTKYKPLMSMLEAAKAQGPEQFAQACRKIDEFYHRPGLHRYFNSGVIVPGAMTNE